MNIFDESSGLETPLLIQEGWTQHQKDAAQPPLTERTGWSGTPKWVVAPDHPVCGTEVGYAAFLLMPQPPLLIQEGSFHAGGFANYMNALEGGGKTSF